LFQYLNILFFIELEQLQRLGLVHMVKQAKRLL